jgi:DNA uptake protein ComE-like DNA-binding protein
MRICVWRLLPAALALSLLSAQHPATEPAPQERPDINRATRRQLEAIRGVGPATAKLILGTRDQLGGFRSFDELHAVPKLSRRVIDAIREAMRCCEQVAGQTPNH